MFTTQREDSLPQFLPVSILTQSIPQALLLPTDSQPRLIEGDRLLIESLMSSNICFLPRVQQQAVSVPLWGPHRFMTSDLPSLGGAFTQYHKSGGHTSYPQQDKQGD